ncbi:MAG: hypothetical protein QGI94_02115 [Candidatus Scalindua sp.]|nr:hypothetical protein [Candidatus Scalindua sp.]
MNNKITVIIIFAVILFCKMPTVHSEESKLYTDEFLFVSTYFNCLSNFVDVDDLLLFANICINKLEKDYYYSEQEVVDSDFMKKLKYEQAYISKMLRKMKEYKNSTNLQIKKAANKILNIFELKKDINIRAQESFYYVKLRKFKAGIAEGTELADEHGSDLDHYSDISVLICDVIFPDYKALRITYKERAHLKQQIEELKKIEWSFKLSLGFIEKQLSIKHSWLPNINP